MFSGIDRGPSSVATQPLPRVGKGRRKGGPMRTPEEESETETKRSGRNIQGDANGLSCDASLGLIIRGDIRQIQKGLTDLEPMLGRNELRLVYKILYPGRLRIKREPITETDAEADGVTDGPS